MPIDRIPLMGEYNSRGALAANSFDYRAENFVPRLVADGVSKTLTPYMEKRTGLTAFASGSGGAASAFLFSRAFNQYVACRELSSSGVSTVYLSTLVIGVETSVGATDSGEIISISEGRFSSVAHLMFATGTSAWYLAADAYSNTAYTADGNNSTTITDIKVGGVNSVSGLYVGQKLTAATNIAAGSRIASINAGAFSAVLTLATTGGAFNDLAITKEPLAKIIDADFPAAPYGLCEMDGRAYVVATSGASVRVYESDLNAISSWGASNFLTMDTAINSTSPYANPWIAKLHERIYASSGTKIEAYFNADRQSGATIARIDEATIDIVAVNAAILDSAVYFVGEIEGINKGLYRITPRGLEKLSSASDDIAIGSTVQLNIPLSATTLWGQTLVYLGAHASSADLVFYVESKKLYEASFGAMMLSHYYAAVYGGDATYQIGNETFQDGGVTFTATIQTARWTGGTQKRKIIDSVRLICDKYSSGTVTLSYSDDDYANFTTHGSAFDLTSMNPRLPRVGSHFGGRVYKITHAVNSTFRATALEIEYRVVG